MLTSLKGIDIIFSDRFSEKIIESLKGLGIEEENIDKSYLLLVAENEQNRLVAFLNVNLIPIKLEYLLIKMILGSYLDFLYKTNKLPAEFNFEQAFKSVKLGDTIVELSEGISQEMLFVSYIRDLRENWKVEAVKCRKLNW